MRCGSLFTGYGGLELGLSEIWDLDTVWVSDVDKDASRILTERFPGVPNLGDITGVDWSRVAPVDVICGGSPCQDLSNAGKLAGMRANTRSGLWSAMRDAINHIQPQYVIWENVKGALSGPADSKMEPCPGCVGDGPGKPVLRALGRVAGDLATIGYDTTWTVVSAAQVGACHIRERVFLLAWPTNPESNRGWLRNRNPSAVENPRRVPRQQGRFGAAVETTLGRPLGVPSRPDRTPGDVKLLPTPDASCQGGQASTFVTLRGLTERGEFGGVLSTSQGHETVDWGQFGAAVERWARVLGRPAPAPTALSPRGKPQLSARFVEWMMGLPDGWVTSPHIGLRRSAALRALGNGVVPQQAAHAVRQLLDTHQPSQHL